MIRKYVKWTKEKCHEEALKYTTRMNFKRGSSGVYEIARKNKWLNEICSHISKNRYWTKEKCQKESLVYKTKREFRKYSSNAYNAAYLHKWLDEICSHMIDKHWTKEKCWNESLKYNTRIEFSIKSRAAYAAAVRHGWLNEICLHMAKLGNRMFRCIYVYEFSDNYAYIGLTYNLQKRNISRRLQNNDAVTKHIHKTNLEPKLKQLCDYVPINEASLLENEYIEIYRKNNWNILNIAKGGAVGSATRIWTKEKCHEEALKYNNRTDFYNNSNRAHIAACRYGWLNDICSHMIIKNKHWIINEIKNEAIKYKSKNEFQVNNNAAYTWAIRHNILDEVCSHMCCMKGTNQYKQKIK